MTSYLRDDSGELIPEARLQKFEGEGDQLWPCGRNPFEEFWWDATVWFIEGSYSDIRDRIWGSLRD